VWRSKSIIIVLTWLHTFSLWRHASTKLLRRPFVYTLLGTCISDYYFLSFNILFSFVVVPSEVPMSRVRFDKEDFNTFSNNFNVRLQVHHSTPRLRIIIIIIISHLPSYIRSIPAVPIPHVISTEASYCHIVTPPTQTISWTWAIKDWVQLRIWGVSPKSASVTTTSYFTS